MTWLPGPLRRKRKGLGTRLYEVWIVSNLIIIVIVVTGGRVPLDDFTEDSEGVGVHGFDWRGCFFCSSGGYHFYPPHNIMVLPHPLNIGTYITPPLKLLCRNRAGLDSGAMLQNQANRDIYRAKFRDTRTPVFGHMHPNPISSYRDGGACPLK